MPTRGARPSSARTSASERSNTHVAPVAAPSAATIASRQRSAPADESCDDDRVGVTIGDDAGQTVGFAVDQPARGVPRILHRRACRDRAAHSALEESGVDAVSAIERPDARADLRGGGVGRAREERALGGDHRHRLARVRRALHRLRPRRRISRDDAAAATSRARASTATRAPRSAKRDAREAAHGERDGARESAQREHPQSGAERAPAGEQRQAARRRRRARAR